MLAIYDAVKNFTHMMKARQFVFFTDHKSLTYAFGQKRDKCKPRQFNDLGFISQFMTDIRHIRAKYCGPRSCSQTGSNAGLHCNTTTIRPLLYVPENFRRQVFYSFHGLHHLGTRATANIFSQRLVWPRVKQHRAWELSYPSCQRSKIFSHTTTP